MFCIRLASMQVLWNGVPSNPFQPSRGIRQGDPISPYLFVICIERLAQAINDQIDKGHLQPFKIYKKFPPMPYLFFADDLMLFAKADSNKLFALTTALDVFCRASSQMISKEKPTLFCSSSVLER